MKHISSDNLDAVLERVNSSQQTVAGIKSHLFLSTDVNSTSHVLPHREEVVLYSICSFMAITILVGTIGNLLVVLAVRTSRKLQTTANVFVVNLSVCDLLFVAVVLPFNIYTYIADGWFLNPRLCQFVGFLGYTLTGTTIITITLISWNRYQLVVNQSQYKELFSRRRIVWMLTVTWVLPVICLLPAILQVWGRFGYVPVLAACNLLISHESQSFKLFLLMVRAGLPCAIIIYHYAHIFLVTRASHRRILSNMPQSTAASSFDLHKQKKELHLTRMMTVIFAVFILSYFPCTITGIIDWNTVLSKSFHMICASTVYAGSAVNPLIYGLMNRQFRQAYSKLLSCGTKATIQKLHLQKEESSDKKIQLRRVSCPASITILNRPISLAPAFMTIVQTPLIQDESSVDDSISCGSSEDLFVYREDKEEDGHDNVSCEIDAKTHHILTHNNTALSFICDKPDFV